MIDTWRDKSIVGSLEARTQFVSDLTSTDKLVVLVERAVHFLYPPFTAMVGRLMSLVKDKETLVEDFKQMVLSIPSDGVWRALDSMYIRFE